MRFNEKLDRIIEKNNSLVCVGLDTDLSKIPKTILSEKNPVFFFNKEIIDATHDLVCAYKPNSAFYEALGLDGITQLRMTMDYISMTYPHIPTILDAKRGDIGNTNKGYITFIFDWLNADAVTLHPYLGGEALRPFFERSDKGIFVLCKTSNSGSSEFQDLMVGTKMLYQIVAEKVRTDWNKNGNCGLVVGATYPQELALIRSIVGDGMPILIPGFGAQGGDIAKTVKAGIDSKGKSAIINSSRGILYASNGEDFANKAREQVITLKDTINSFR